MLTYLQVLLIFIVPPIIGLGCLFSPMMGRREVLKISWLILMATIYTTPWDNFIIARGGWSYPAGSIIGTIYCIPIEEHLFFILQPILIVLLHCIFTHSTLLPFRLPQSTRRRLQNQKETTTTTTTEKQKQNPRTVKTLHRRPLAASLWALMFFAGLYLVNDAHEILPEWTIQEHALGMRAFYLGWIMLWISPVLGWLTYLGSDMGRGEWKTMVVGSGWLCIVDTIAIRNGAWSIAEETSLGIDIWRGLPLEECLFFILTTHLIIISTNLISHLHALLVLCPDLPPCPPSNLAYHIQLLARVAFSPPSVPEDTLIGLVHAEETLREGSKSFDVAKLAFGREMRIALVAVYAWCRMTDNIVDDDPTETSDSPDHELKTEYLAAIKAHLIKSYDPATSPNTLNALLDHLPLSPADRTVFHTFTNLVPRLVPIHPFLELCNGYETDLHFTRKLAQPNRKLEDCLPILTQADLLGYADDVAGSVASACCYLAWSILSTSTDNPTRPVRDHVWGTGESDKAEIQGEDRRRILQNAREMGHALQLVNIARDVKKDVLTNRLYIPLSYFPDIPTLHSFLHPTPEIPAPDSRPYVMELVEHAFVLRERTAPYMNLLPREAKGGLRAMVASYFEIAEEIMRRQGEVTDTGVKVSKKRRLRAAASAMWGFT